MHWANRQAKVSIQAASAEKNCALTARYKQDYDRMIVKSNRFKSASLNLKKGSHNFVK